MYELARTLVPHYLAVRRVAEARQPIPKTVELERFSVADQEAFDERAGIMEFDGGLERSEAESRAREIVFGPKTGDTE
jgi:hypothetical protein